MYFLQWYQYPNSNEIRWKIVFAARVQWAIRHHWIDNSSSPNQYWQRWSAYLSVFMVQRLHTINASSSLVSAILTHWSKYKCINIISYKPISQIPKRTCSISHNAPFRTEMCTFLFWMDHCRIWDRSIVGFVNYVNYCTRNYASTSTL